MTTLLLCRIHAYEKDFFKITIFSEKRLLLLYW